VMHTSWLLCSLRWRDYASFACISDVWIQIYEVLFELSLPFFQQTICLKFSRSSCQHISSSVRQALQGERCYGLKASVLPNTRFCDEVCSGTSPGARRFSKRSYHWHFRQQLCLRRCCSAWAKLHPLRMSEECCVETPLVRTP
jgi:hypothetical protein